MQLGRGFTAARRWASRLAGLVQIPASCTAKTAIRRRASWLAEKAGVDLISRWPFGVAQIFSLRRLIPSRKGWVCPPPTASEQSGDRQRREKGPPILTAEIGEHERAPRACESYPTSLRATLRAPPAKWVIKAFFRRVSEANQGRGQPLRAVCPRNVVRLFRPLGRNWMPRINSGRPTVRLPQTEAWAERERVPSGHNCRRQLATGRPEQIQEPGTAVPGTPIFANNAQRGGPPL